MFKRKLSGHLLAKSHRYVYMYMYNLYAKHLSVTQEISNRIFSCWPAKIVENSFNDTCSCLFEFELLWSAVLLVSVTLLHAWGYELITDFHEKMALIFMRL